MKQDSPLRKGDKHFDAIKAYINKQTPTQIEAKRRETDEHICADPWSRSLDEVENDPVPVLAKPVREALAELVAGVGLGFGVLGVLDMLFGNEDYLNMLAVGCVISMLIYFWLDSGKDAGKS